jgi:ferrochelatase
MSINQQKGVLLINLGTPDAPTRSAVHRYLNQFLTDGRVIDINAVARNILVRGIIAPLRSGKSAAAYKILWTKEGSPLKVFGFSLRDKVQQELGDNYMVELAMRYQKPSIEEALNKLMKASVSEIIVLPLFPHYASATTGSVHEEVMRLLTKQQVIPKTTFINSYYDHPKLIEAFVDRAKTHNIDDYDHVLFSYHGLPKRHLVKGDQSGSHCMKKENCCNSICDNNKFCYSAQCYATTYAIADALNLDKEKYSICFQSRLGRDPWLEPYTSDMLKKRNAAGDKKILVFCPAFVADCLETTVEISHEYAEEFEKMGGEHLELVEGLNDSPKWVEAACQIIRENSL